jgi:hypothetical protein
MMIVQCFGEKFLRTKYGRERNDIRFDREFNSLSNDVVFFSRAYLKPFEKTFFQIW